MAATSESYISGFYERVKKVLVWRIDVCRSWLGDIERMSYSFLIVTKLDELFIGDLE